MCDLENNAETEENGNDYTIHIPEGQEPDDPGLGYMYFTKMTKYKNRIAQYIVETSEEDTYEHLLQRCVRTALEIKRRNLTKDSIVVLCSYNHKESIVPFIASTFLGIPVASLDPLLSVLDTAHLLKQVQPKIIFVVPAALQLIEYSIEEVGGLECEIVVYGESENYTAFSEFLKPHENEDLFEPVTISDITETAIIFFSSGTTGLPKGIMISHYSILRQIITMLDSHNVGSVTFSYASLYWISSVILCSASIYYGGAKVICSSYNPEELWNIIDKYRVSLLFLAPHQAIDMVKVGRPENLNTTNLNGCVIGGGAISESHLNNVRDLLPGTFVSQAYGQTELAGPITIFNLGDVKSTLFLHYKPNSCGMMISSIKYKVVNVDTEEICGPHEQGELRIKSKIVMNGYYKRDSSEAYDSDGWLKTGDIVYYDEDDCFYIIDRIKEILKYKSWHVPPALIEQILDHHPAVEKSIVVGIPHDEDGDHPAAVVILEKHAVNTVSATELENFVAERVPDRMRLRGGVKFVDEMPLTPSGKIKRNGLKEMFLKGEI